jgi:hypothetical protein
VSEAGSALRHCPVRVGVARAPAGLTHQLARHFAPPAGAKVHQSGLVIGGPPPNTGQILVIKYWSNTGQILVEYWSNTGQILVEYWSNTPPAPWPGCRWTTAVDELKTVRRSSPSTSFVHSFTLFARQLSSPIGLIRAANGGVAPLLQPYIRTPSSDRGKRRRPLVDQGTASTSE